MKIIKKCNRLKCKNNAFMHGECYHHYFIAWGEDSVNV